MEASTAMLERLHCSESSGSTEVRVCKLTQIVPVERVEKLKSFHRQPIIIYNRSVIEN